MKNFIADLVPQYLSPKEAIEASFVENIRELKNHVNSFIENGFYDEAEKIQEIINKIEIPENFRESWKKYINTITGLHAGAIAVQGD